MGEPDARSEDGPAGSHRKAAAAFARRVEQREVPAIEELLLFGSTARGEASGIESDVDFLAIVADDADRKAIEERLRDIAYDVMLEFGPVVEVHVPSRSAFERRREHPFVRRLLREGTSYA